MRIIRDLKIHVYSKSPTVTISFKPVWQPKLQRQKTARNQLYFCIRAKVRIVQLYLVRTIEVLTFF